MDSRSEPAGGETEQATARADINEGLPGQRVDAQHAAQRSLPQDDLLFGQGREEIRPVLAKLESIPAGHFPGLAAFGSRHDYLTHLSPSAIARAGDATRFAWPALALCRKTAVPGLPPDGASAASHLGTWLKRDYDSRPPRAPRRKCTDLRRAAVTL